MKNLSIKKLSLLSVILVTSILGATELLYDSHFRNGFKLVGTNSGSPGVKNIVQPPVSGVSNTVWKLAEWNSNSTLATSMNYNQWTSDNSSTGWRWANSQKSVTIGLGKGSDLTLAINTTNEQKRKPNDKNWWPHLLVEQSFSPNLKVTNDLYWSFDARLKYWHHSKRAGVNNASEFVTYLLIKNKNNSDKLWLGFTIFSSPENYGANEFLHIDDNTNTMIYKIGVPQVRGKGKTYNYNVADMIRKALSKYKDTTITVENAVITSMNMGWEVHGLDVGTISINNLSLHTNGNTGGHHGGVVNPNPGTQNKVFNFNRNKNREGWHSINMNEQFGGPNGGKWYFACNKYDPMLFSPKLSLNGSIYKKVQITMANDHNPSKYSYIKVYWKRKGDRNFSESRSAYARIHNDGGWRTYTLYPKWSGEISEIRVDPIAGGNGHWIGIDAIKIVR